MTLADLLTDLGNAVGMDAFVGSHPGKTPRDDRREVRGFPRELQAAVELLGAFPAWVGELARLSGPPDRVWYRGGGHQAEIRVLDVTALGFAHAGAFVVAAIEHDADAVLDSDVEGKIVAVTLDEGGGERRFVVGRGLTTAPWAFVISADARESAAAVADAASDVIRSAG